MDMNASEFILKKEVFFPTSSFSQALLNLSTDGSLNGKKLSRQQELCIDVFFEDNIENLRKANDMDFKIFPMMSSSYNGLVDLIMIFFHHPGLYEDNEDLIDSMAMVNFSTRGFSSSYFNISEDKDDGVISLTKRFGGVNQFFRLANACRENKTSVFLNPTSTIKYGNDKVKSMLVNSDPYASFKSWLEVFIDI